MSWYEIEVYILGLGSAVMLTLEVARIVQIEFRKLRKGRARTKAHDKPEENETKTVMTSRGPRTRPPSVLRPPLPRVPDRR